MNKKIFLLFLIFSPLANAQGDYDNTFALNSHVAEVRKKSHPDIKVTANKPYELSAEVEKVLKLLPDSIKIDFDPYVETFHSDDETQPFSRIVDSNLIIEELSLGYIIKGSKGSENKYLFRQLSHIAPGTDPTDAVNLYQMQQEIDNKLNSRIGKVEEIENHNVRAKRSADNTETSESKTIQHEKTALKAKTNSQEHMTDAKLALTKTEEHRDEAKTAFDAIVKHRNDANQALTETTGHRDNAYDALIKVKGHENTANSIVERLKREASSVEGEVTQDSDGTMHIGEALKGTQIFVSGKQGDRVISGVASGARNSDAVNVSQLNTVRTTANYASQLAQKNSSRINHLEDRLSKTNTKIERGLATSAALTGLFQPYGVGKVNFTASIGGYGASQALAVGTGYRITENAAVKAGVAYSGGNHVMYNASFNFEW
ncbi:hypothetical protein CBG25_19665 [Arsenophonus sp. ENCA]|uniref:YadA-like family protein n=1 Tax=Arsenophonus sp. ENCA TaxID=1987579 RepID=UPI000BCFF9CF|nr:YadA-like family protein [Arsenophonus sp. ENCA]PAU99994.1 hypothetical protein CBG25_19665 [Arsenophonus sp. ENCA]